MNEVQSANRKVLAIDGLFWNINSQLIYASVDTYSLLKIFLQSVLDLRKVTKTWYKSSSTFWRLWTHVITYLTSAEAETAPMPAIRLANFDFTH